MIEDEVLNRIQFFLKYKHWSVYKLAKRSDLSYSSLNNIFNRRTCPTVSTLEKICIGLNISLSEFFAFQQNPLQSETLTEKEQEVLNAYQSLSANDKALLEAYLQGLCKK